jgi:hypothetical protein
MRIAIESEEAESITIDSQSTSQVALQARSRHAERITIDFTSSSSGQE